MPGQKSSDGETGDTEGVSKLEKDKGMEKLNSFQLKDIQGYEDEKTELELQREEESLPIQVRERRQTVQVYEVFKEKA